jgi:PRC-barrel domain
MRATGIVPALHDAPLRDRDGRRLGTVEDMLFDTTTHRPIWLVVRLADGRRTVAPARGSRPGVDGTRVRVAAEVVAGCPVSLTGSPALGREHVVRVCRHYGVPVPRGTWTDALEPVRAAVPAAILTPIAA